MKKYNQLGHLYALITIVIWGTTFISTKLLLVSFRPIEILFLRFIIGFIALCIIDPHRLQETNKQQERTFALAGLCGICLYYLIENIALTYTSAAHVGVIISIAPFFTAVLSHFFLDKEKLHISFYLGFIIAVVGICMMSFQGTDLQLNPLGDFLAILAAFIWACYSILTRKISEYEYPTILTTRRIFSYGILFMIPVLFFFDFDVDMYQLIIPSHILNILFLGLGASALCFVTWNKAVQLLGAVKTSVYIYLVPVITFIASILFLHEEMTLSIMIGIILTLSGLLLSEYKPKKEGE